MNTTTFNICLWLLAILVAVSICIIFIKSKKVKKDLCKEAFDESTDKDIQVKSIDADKLSVKNDLALNNKIMLYDKNGDKLIQLNNTNGDIQGTNIKGSALYGKVYGDVSGNNITARNIKGALTGDVTGNVKGNLTGNVTGSSINANNITGNVKGNLTGNVTGTSVAASILKGNLTGGVTGDVKGNVTGNVKGNLTGGVTGDVKGNVTGNVKGTLSGNVSGGTITASSITNNGALNNKGDATFGRTVNISGKINADKMQLAKEAIIYELYNTRHINNGGNINNDGNIINRGALDNNGDATFGRNVNIKGKMNAYNLQLAKEARTYELYNTRTLNNGGDINNSGNILNNGKITTRNGLEVTSNISSVRIGGKSLLDILYPVGSIYTSMNSTSPATLFGGTWTQIKDRFLYCTTSSNRLGGSNNMRLTTSHLPSHNHSFSGSTSSNGNHSHSYAVGCAESTTRTCCQRHTMMNNGWCNRTSGQAGNHSHTFSGTTRTTGSNASFSIMPQYVTCYAWYRTK